MTETSRVFLSTSRCTLVSERTTCPAALGQRDLAAARPTLRSPIPNRYRPKATTSPMATTTPTTVSFIIEWGLLPQGNAPSREKRDRGLERLILGGRHCLYWRRFRAGLRRRRLVEQPEHAFVQAVSYLKALRGAGDVANNDIDSRGARAHFHGGVRRKLAQAGVAGTAFPLGFGKARVLFGFLEHGGVDEFDHGVVFLRRGDAEPDLIPHPLAGSREVKILTLDSEAVDETDAAPRRMALIRPVARLEHGGAEKTDLRNLARDAIDLHPIANPDAMLT